MNDVLTQLRPPHRLHFIGIGGDGMSSLAGLMHAEGYRISGSEQADAGRTKQSSLLERFIASGINICVGHRAENVHPDIVVVVRSSAVQDDHVELKQAVALRIPVVKRAELLGWLMEGRTGVAVAGTAGKSTTTAMLGLALQLAGADPVVSLGAIVPEFNESNYRAGNGPFFVAEADEFDRSFFHMRFKTAIVTQLFFGDHPETYRDLDDLQRAFRHFLGMLPSDGVAIGCGDITAIREVLSAAPYSETYGFNPDNDWNVTAMDQIGPGTQFSFRGPGQRSGDCSIALPGRHVVLNALAVIASTASMGFSPTEMTIHLATFQGCARRFQFHGSFRGVRMYDDYAHHPVQIEATLGALRQLYPKDRIFCVFEPRQFLRTQLMLHGYPKAFRRADCLIVTDISYGLGEDSATTGNVDSENIASIVRGGGTEACYVRTLDRAAEYLVSQVRDSDVVVTMGTGKVAVCLELLKELLS